jgi:hypothetical protein
MTRNNSSSFAVARRQWEPAPGAPHPKSRTPTRENTSDCGISTGRQLEPLEARLLLSNTVAPLSDLGIKQEIPAIALIDIRLPDQQLLVQSLPNVTKIFFDSESESAATVLQQAVNSAKDFDGSLQSVMIFSHGESGEFALGTDLISADTLSATASLWKSLGQQIAPGGSIDLFGCDSAMGTAGQNLLDQIHLLSDASVFGSTNITGKDGDWTLEAHSASASVATPLPILYNLLSAYSADLGIVTIQTAAAANPSTVTGTTSALSVLAADTSGESHVTYTWSATVKPLGANPIFSVNASNAAKNTTITFDQAGPYTFTVTASDGLFFAISAVVVTVNQTVSHIAIAPSSASLNLNQSQLFTATADDQFGQALTIPPTISWSIDAGGVGSIDALGLYSSGTTPGLATVRATSGAVSGSAVVTVTDQGPTVLIGAAATPNPVVNDTTILSVLGQDDGGESNVTYTWLAIAKPTGSNPSFNANGTNGSKVSVVTFDKAGDYTFQVTISDGTLSTTSSVNVEVIDTLVPPVVPIPPLPVLPPLPALPVLPALPILPLPALPTLPPILPLPLLPPLPPILPIPLPPLPPVVPIPLPPVLPPVLPIPPLPILPPVLPIVPLPPVLPVLPVPAPLALVAPQPIPPTLGPTSNAPAGSPSTAAPQATAPVEARELDAISVSDTPSVVSPNLYIATIAITTGILSQLLIPGSFLASMFTSLPAWRWFDPVSILNSRGRSRMGGVQPNHDAGDKETKLKELLK